MDDVQVVTVDNEWLKRRAEDAAAEKIRQAKEKARAVAEAI